jgi:hypothetical protein
VVALVELFAVTAIPTAAALLIVTAARRVRARR